MKYQAFILIFVILVSLYVLKEPSVFSEQHIPNAQQARVLSTLSDTADTMVREIPVPVETPVTVENAFSDFIERPAVEPPSVTNNSCPTIDAKIYLVKYLDRDRAVLEKNPLDRWPIASITKLMTATIALERLDLSKKIVISDEVRQAVGENGSFAVGQEYTVLDLIKASLVFSSNDAAYALASALGSNEFVSAMNQRAKEIGMSQTSFYEPSGLSYLNQSTAYDLYALMNFLYRQHPNILEMSRQKSVSLYDYSVSKRRSFSNIDFFAGSKNFFGGKTGFIEQSGGNLVTLFQKNGKMVFVGVLSSADRFGEIEKLLSCVE